MPSVVVNAAPCPTATFGIHMAAIVDAGEVIIGFDGGT